MLSTLRSEISMLLMHNLPVSSKVKCHILCVKHLHWTYSITTTEPVLYTLPAFSHLHYVECQYVTRSNKTSLIARQNLT